MSKTADALLTMEDLIDHGGLSNFLSGVATICREKAQHIAENWQDERSARAWEVAARAIERCAQTEAVRRVS